MGGCGGDRYALRLRYLGRDVAEGVVPLTAAQLGLLLEKRKFTRCASKLSTRVLEIDSLKLQIAKLRHMQCVAKSEKLDRTIGQLELRLEELQAHEGAAEADATPVSRATARTPDRQALPEHLPCRHRITSPKPILPGLWRGAAPVGRVCLRTTRACAGPLADVALSNIGGFAQ